MPRNRRSDMTGAELRAIRLRLRLLQGEFGERLGLSLNQVSRAERGLSGISRTVAILARLLNAGAPIAFESTPGTVADGGPQVLDVRVPPFKRRARRRRSK